MERKFENVFMAETLSVKFGHSFEGSPRGVIIGNLQTIPFHEFQFHKVPLIPYSVITKKILF